MKKYTKSPGKYFWTGLRDIDSHGEYSWTGVGGVKQAVTFSNWNFLEPCEWITFKVVEYDDLWNAVYLPDMVFT